MKKRSVQFWRFECSVMAVRVYNFNGQTVQTCALYTNCQDFIDSQTLEFDLELFLSTLKEKTHPELSLTSDPFENIISIIEGELEKERNLWLICRGHDITKLILFTLHHIVGKEFVRKDLINVFQLERELRMAYDNNLFKKSRLYQSIKEWEENNRPFKILKYEK